MSVLFWIFAAILVAGIALAVSAASSGNRRPREILAERLARGEISAEEYRQSLAALGGRSGASRAAAPAAAAAFIALGVLGILFAWASGGFRVGGMMSGSGMSGMMRQMRGEAGRSGPGPEEGAPNITVVAFEFGFEPKETKVPSGETFNLVFDNRGHMFHTLTIGRLGFDLRANPGRSRGSNASR